MARLWHLLLLSWAWSPLCLSASMGFIGSPRECENAPFVPGYSLGGEGFDIVTMERKGAYVIDTATWDIGNKTCKMFRNSYMDNERQKVPAAMVDWRPLPECKLEVSGIVYNSVERLVNDSTSAVSNDWKTGLNISVDPSGTSGFSLGGSFSKESRYAMDKSKQDHYTFLRHSVDCSLYGYRLATHPPLSRDFKLAVNSLPSYSYNTVASYRSLIDTYGTHYIRGVFLGGQIKAITSVKTCEATMSGLSATEVGDCLSVEASASFGSTANIEVMTKECQSKMKKLGYGHKFSIEFSERNMEVIGGNIDGTDVLFNGQSNPTARNNWLKSLKNTPDVVKYSIHPLHTLLPSSHSARDGLKQEVEKYIKKNAVLEKCSESCKIGHRSNGGDSCACVCNSNENIESNCCPVGRGLATLTVFNLYADGLYGDRLTETDGSVEVKYRDQIKRTVIIRDNDNPRWPETFEFGPIVMDTQHRLQFYVYDEDSYRKSDLLGQCSVLLHKGTQSLSCMMNHGTLFFSYKVECVPSLSGDQCQDYTPSPMSLSLARVFRSRNGVLLGRGKRQSG